MPRDPAEKKMTKPQAEAARLAAETRKLEAEARSLEADAKKLTAEAALTDARREALAREPRERWGRAALQGLVAGLVLALAYLLGLGGFARVPAPATDQSLSRGGLRSELAVEAGEAAAGQESAEPVPEPVPEPVVTAVVEPEPEPVVVKAEPREAEKPQPKVVAKAMDINREPDQTTPFSQAPEVMSEGVGTSDIFDEIENDTVKVAFKGSSFVLSAGFLTWALRGASLLASVAASLPAWQGFDPLPVLAAKKRDKKKDEDGDDNGGDKNDADWQEKRIQRLFNSMDSTEND